MTTPLIAFLYNVRHSYPDPKDPSTHKEADFDDRETIVSMTKHLRQCGYRVMPIEADENAYTSLYNKIQAIHLVFNYSMGINGRDRYTHIPAMCEMLQIPYTGCSPATEALVMNKSRTKQLCIANKIPTLPYQLFRSADDTLNPYLSYPLIVKPVAQGSSAGITNDSVVYNLKALKRQVSLILSTFNEPALVEPFLTGREFSVAMLGNPPKIFPIIEADHTSLPNGYLPLDSLEVKWYIEEQQEDHHLICPALIDIKLHQKLENICKQVWNVLEIQDFCRIDLRCDTKNNPFVLEVNTPPGLIPPEVSLSSYFPLAARAVKISYDDLLKTIISESEKRNRKKGDSGKTSFH